MLFSLCTQWINKIGVVIVNVSIDVQESDRKVRVKLKGEIDAYTAPKVRNVLLPPAEKHGIKIIIDLSAVTYMDSTGLGVFVGLFKKLRENDGHLSLEGMSERLHRLFDITGLAEVMGINNEVEGGV